MPETLRISREPGDNEEGVLEKISRERFIRLGTALGVGAGCASLVRLRDDLWIDWGGSMITEAAKLRERIRRTDFGHLALSS